MCYTIFVRTTLDLPDDLFRALKARAALSGVTLRELTRRLIEQGLRSPGPLPGVLQREPPPVIIPPRGTPIAAASHAELVRQEEQEDEDKHGRSA